MNEPFWNKERDDVIRSMFSERKTAKEVGEALGVTRNAVLGRAYRLGLSKPWHEKRQKTSLDKKKPRNRVGRKPGMSNTDYVKLVDQLKEEKIDQVISDAREVGMSWQSIAEHLGITMSTARHWAMLTGVFVKVNAMRRFTDDEIKTIIEDYGNYVPVEEIADKVGHSFGVVHQKVFQLQIAGRLGGRDGNGVRIVKNYGREFLKEGVDPTKTLIELKQAKEAAVAAAYNSAREARERRYEVAIKQMHHAIESGVDRNRAIFQARAEGVTLERLAQEVGGLTRERIRQICNQVAKDIAMTNYRQAQAEGEEK
jgi:hypothetical protein